VAGLGPGGDHLDGQLFPREPARTATRRNTAPGRVLERGAVAPPELRGQQHLLELFARDLPPRRLKHADQLIVREGTELTDRILGQRQQSRPRREQLRLITLPEPRQCAPRPFVVHFSSLLPGP
jgi:hypothetical protein